MWQLYFTENQRTHRLLYGIAMLWCIGIYILGLYPAWQVSFGYVFLLMLIWVTKQERLHLSYIKQDIWFWLPGLAIMLAPIINIILVSSDVIQITKATEYPGARFEVGGNWPSVLSWSSLYSISIFLPFKDITVLNNCEAANFFSLSPLGLIAFFYLLHKGKRDALLFLMAGISILFMFWAFLGIPAWLAKTSMFYAVTSNRGKAAADFLNLLMLCRGVYLIQRHGLMPSKIFKLSVAVVTASLATFCIYQFAPDYINMKKILISTAVVAITSCFFLPPISKKGVLWIFILMLSIGGTINPVARGIDSIYAQPLGQKIAEIAAKDNSLWIIDEDYWTRDYPIMFGAPTINSVNTYPALERWKQLDDGKNFKIYNRYAHITTKIVDQNSDLTFELKYLDAFDIKLRPSDLKKLDVKYILTRNKLESLSTNSISFSEIFEDHGFRIYEMKQ